MAALGRGEDALAPLLRSLALDTPRAEVCCDMGGWFLARARWRQAAFWYELALTRKRDDTSGAFVSPDCYGYLPAIQLCVCWYHLGDVEKAKAFNELAASFRPEDPSVLQNRTFFSSLSSVLTFLDKLPPKRVYFFGRMSIFTTRFHAALDESIPK